MTPALPVPTFAASPAGLTLEGVALADIAAQFGTPTYVYPAPPSPPPSSAYQQAPRPCKSLVCYAVKANSSLGILSVFAKLGAGFDIVSGGELARVLAAGGDAGKVIFSGVGKTRDEMRARWTGIGCFNVESAAELDRLAEVAASMGKRAPIAFRVNPDVNPAPTPTSRPACAATSFGWPSPRRSTCTAGPPGCRTSRSPASTATSAPQLLDPAPMAGRPTRSSASSTSSPPKASSSTTSTWAAASASATATKNRPPHRYLAPLLARFEGRDEALCFEPGRSWWATPACCSPHRIPQARRRRTSPSSTRR